MTEKEYRALPYDSYSTLKVFNEDRKKYYKKFVENVDVEEDEDEQPTKALLMGSLVDCLKYEKDQFDELFSLTAIQAPTGQMLSFTNALFQKSVACMDDKGEITRSFEVLTKEAYNQVRFNRAGDIVAFKKKTLEKVIEDFVDSDAELYYRHLLKARGKTVIELYEVQTAERIVNTLNNNWVTKEIMSIQSNKDYDVYTQLVIVFEYKGYKLKSKLDQVIVDHKTKSIILYDLKTCWDNDKNFEYNFFKYKYYLQAAVYYLAALFWAEKEGWKDYVVVPMQFIAVDSNNYQNPLIYQTDLVNLRQGLEGFVVNGRYHPGVNKAIQDLTWHKTNNIWEISRENHEAGGIVKIKPFIEDEYQR